MPNDYISREAALSKIGNISVGAGYECGAEKEECIDVLMDIPAADVAPVVRCKDCRFYEVKQSKLCDMHNRAADENDYCSYGVQRKVQEEKA